MKAVLGEAALLAPTLGRWRPGLSIGASVSEGVVLGTLERVGQRSEVIAPQGARGQVLATAEGYVQYGDVLLEIGILESGASSPEPVVQPGGRAVRAPLPGIVYLRPAPNEAAFAPVGSTVRRNATVALIEVMKTFTPLKCASEGVVRSVAVGNGDAVEADDAILWLE